MTSKVIVRRQPTELRIYLGVYLVVCGVSVFAGVARAQSLFVPRNGGPSVVCVAITPKGKCVTCQGTKIPTAGGTVYNNIVPPPACLPTPAPPGARPNEMPGPHPGQGH